MFWSRNYYTYLFTLILSHNRLKAAVIGVNGYNLESERKKMAKAKNTHTHWISILLFSLF